MENNTESPDQWTIPSAYYSGMELQPKTKSNYTHTYLNDQKDTAVFSVLTYNIWLEEKYSKERTLKIVNTIKRHMPDIVCLQEVTEYTLDIIKKKLEPYYQNFHSFVEERKSYGMCFLCKRDTVKVLDRPYYYEYDGITSMSRDIIGCEVEFLKLPKMPFHVMTTHLESLPDNDHLRSEQFDVISEVIKPLKNLVLLGDFNIYSLQEDIERKISNSKLKDSWVEVGCPNRIKHTINYRKNSNVRGKVLSRSDRIYYSTNNPQFSVNKMSLLGLEQTSYNVSIPPSYHYGLLAEFRLDRTDI